MNKLAKKSSKQRQDGSEVSKKKVSKAKKVPELVASDSEEEESEVDETVRSKRKAVDKQKEPTVKKAKKKSKAKQLNEDEADAGNDGADEPMKMPSPAVDSVEQTSQVNPFFVGKLPLPYNDEVEKSVVKFFAENEIELSAKGTPGNKSCICTLSNFEDSEKMLALNGANFEGSILIIRKTKPTPETGKRVCLKPLDPSKMTMDDLKEITGAERASIVTAKRLGFVTFEKESQAKTLVDKGTLTINGCEMTVQMARARPNQRSASNLEKQNRTCFNCGKRGHVSRFCSRSKK